MEDLNLKTEIEKEKIIKLLEQIFPELTVFHYQFGKRQPKKLNLENPLHIFFHTVKMYSTREFDFQLRIYRTSSACETERALFIAEKLSDEFSVLILIKGSGFPFLNKDVTMILNDMLFQDHQVFIVNETGAI